MLITRHSEKAEDCVTREETLELHVLNFVKFKAQEINFILSLDYHHDCMINIAM